MATIAEKILAAHSGQSRVSPGEFVRVKVDVVLANDITAPISLDEFRKLGIPRVFDPEKVVLVQDHFIPNKDIPSAIQAKVMREFAHEQGVTYFEAGRAGIEHVLLPQEGVVGPGQVIIGADSHTCTYGALGAFSTGMGSTDIGMAWATGDIWMKVPPTIKFVFHGKLKPWVGGKDLILHTIGAIGVDGALYAAMEFHGEAIASLPMDGRFTMANMAIEAGGKAGIFPVDEKTEAYVAAHPHKSGPRPVVRYATDSDADYVRIVEFDASTIEPSVAFPHKPSNTRPVSQAGSIPIDQVVIGSCTNGRLSDLIVAAGILKGRKVHPRVVCIVIPATQRVYSEAMEMGLVKTFIDAGAVVSTPTCGPCLGGYMGVLAPGEKCVSTTNRNFVGRMGSRQSEVYLAGPAVAAASAIAGHIAGPEEVQAQ
ncbi:MAG: 3-isopropylmalate dehydratase large subunit [Dehalococcoidia bacterium]|jgi:3-isopropylmalate/(R)-2-methylmalate dehydratase large subunit|nr:3-isopropylmalate dehydratase large subunit [Dehalococcoidia bacterium]